MKATTCAVQQRLRWMGRRFPGLILGLVLLAGPVSATTITLNFTTLPSAQGWQFVGQNISESAAFSVDGTTLYQNTIGSDVSGMAYYQMPNVLDTTQPYTIEVRARIVDQEFSDDGPFSFAATATQHYALVALNTNRITIIEDGPNPQFPFDNTEFHDYRFAVSPNGSYSLFIDAQLFTSGLIASDSLPNLVYFGDGSSSINGQAEITRFVFSQGPTNPVPEPSTFLLFGTGGGWRGWSSATSSASASLCQASEAYEARAKR